MLNSQRSELIDISYNARNWNVVFENLLEDCLNFPDESCKSSYGPDWRSEHLALEQILGKGWMRCRQNLLSQARQCSSWRTLFISLLESVSVCLSELDSNAQRKLGEFKRKSGDMMLNLLENNNIDRRTAEFMRVTVAEILRFIPHTIQVSGAAELLSGHLEMLNSQQLNFANIFGLDSYEKFFDLTSKFCENELSGAVFSEKEQSDQRSILRKYSSPKMDSASDVVSLTRQVSVPATTYMSTPETSYIPTHIEIEKIEIKSNADLLLRTKLSQEGKTIIFSDKRIEPAFKSVISVHFPPCSVLAEEKICLEIIPESIVEAYNEKITKEKTKENKNAAKARLITPILHIDRENDAPFLRTVNVVLPLFGDVTYKSGETKIAEPSKLTVTEGTVRVAAVKFSPVAVAEVNKILRPLKLDRDFNYSFDELGIYLLSEQLENRHFRMDLRKFSDWQEHRRFRMDESKWLILVISPHRIQPGDIDTKVEAHLRDPITIRNDWESSRIILGNRVVFYFPDPQLPPDATNVRNMTLNSNRECQQFPLKLEYETENLEEFAISEVLFIPYHAEDRINYFLHVRVPNSENIMMRLLQLLGENWLKFLDRYLQVDIQGLFEFLSNDIRDTFPTERLHWVSQNVQRLREICIRRDFVIRPTSQHSRDIIEDIFSNFRTALEMGRAKREICALLLDCGIISTNAGFTDNLLERNREILAAALMYIPMGTLKHAICQAFDANLLPVDVVLQKFVNDGVPEGDRL